MTKKLKELLDLIKADDLGQVPDDTGASNLIKPLSTKVIEEIREANVLRRMFPSITIPKNARQLSVPVVIHGSTLNVHTVGYGTDVSTKTENSMTTKSIVLAPRLLVAWIDVIEDDLETAGVDLARYIRQSLTLKIAEAEEAAMYNGVYNAAEGTHINAFNGLYTLAAGASCASTAVTYSGSSTLVEDIATARKNLGAYGRNPNDLVLLCTYTFANRLRTLDKVYNVNYNPATDVLKTGTLPPIHGIKIIETNYLETKESGEVAILCRKDAFITGVRKNIFVKTDEIVEKFTNRIIMAEEIDFKPQFKNASDKYEGVVLIHKAS